MHFARLGKGIQIQSPYTRRLRSGCPAFDNHSLEYQLSSETG